MSDDRLEEPFGDDEDAQLAYAIALSLQDIKKPSQESVYIPSTTSTDGEDMGDLDQPLRGSKPPPAPTMTPAATQGTRPNVPALRSTDTPSGIGLLGLDRKKMEEERLARVGKRSAPDSEVESQGRKQRPRPVLGSESLQKARASSPLVPRVHAPLVPETLSSSMPTSSGSDGTKHKLVYPKGVIKKTYVRGQPRTDNDITIEEVLQREQLKFAVLSSFQWDEEWLLSKIDSERTKLMLVAYAPNDSTKAQMLANAPSKLVRFCFPPMHGAGCMHSKLQLLKFPSYMRIVVPTGNLVPYDWGETAHQENALFLIDIPKKATREADRPPELPRFAEDLFYFLRASSLDEKLVSSLEEGYDFSETSRYGFVHTIAGSHKADDSWQRTGYCGLGRTVKSLGLATNDQVEIDAVASSIGSLKTSFLTCLYNAAQGDSGMKELESRLHNKSRKPGAKKAAVSSEGDQMALLKERFRIYFPSHQTITRSMGGTQGAGTICFQRQWWNSPSFPRALLRDCKNATRPGVLMHNKMIFVRPFPWLRDQGQELDQKKKQGDIQAEKKKDGPPEARALSGWLGGGGSGESGLGKNIRIGAEQMSGRAHSHATAGPGGVRNKFEGDNGGGTGGGGNGDGRSASEEHDNDYPSSSRSSSQQGTTSGIISALASAGGEAAAAATTSQPCPWVYVGSANLSESAWGHLTMDTKTKTPKLMCRNWECGVVVPVLRGNGSGSGSGQLAPSLACISSATHAEADWKGKGKTSARRAWNEEHERPDEQQQQQPQPRPAAVPDIDVFQNTVPVPFEVPTARLDGGGGEGAAAAGGGPWFFMEH